MTGGSPSRVPGGAKTPPAEKGSASGAKVIAGVRPSAEATTTGGGTGASSHQGWLTGAEGAQSASTVSHQRPPLSVRSGTPTAGPTGAETFTSSRARAGA